MHRFNKCMLLIIKGKFDWRYIDELLSNCRLQTVKIKNCRFEKCRSGCNFIQTKVHGQGHSEKDSREGKTVSHICTACCWLKLMNLMFHSGGHYTCQMSSPATRSVNIMPIRSLYIYIYISSWCLSLHVVWVWNVEHKTCTPLSNPSNPTFVLNPIACTRSRTIASFQKEETTGWGIVVLEWVSYAFKV